LRSRVHAKFELRLLAVVCREPFEEESPEVRSSAATERVENKKALEATTVIRKLTDFVHSWVKRRARLTEGAILHESLRASA